MKTDTRISARDIPGSYIVSLVVVTLMIVGGIGTVEWQKPSRLGESELDVLYGSRAPAITFPHTFAGGLTIVRGLNEFSGKSTPPLSPRANALLAFSFLLMYVVGPVLLFAAVRRRFTGSGSRLIRVSTLIGLVLGGFWMAAVIPATLVQFRLHANLQHSQSIQRTKDGLINHIGLVKINAAQYFILPWSAGGGGGSYSAYSLPHRLQESPFGTITVEGLADSLRITARPSIESLSRWTDRFSGTAVEATVSTVIVKTRFARHWEYTGIFQ